LSIKLSDLLRFDIKPFLYGVLLSRIKTNDNKDIPDSVYVYTDFRSSKAVNYTDFNFKKYSSKLREKYNNASGYKNWHIKRVTDSSMKLIFPIKNDLNLDIIELNRSIYKKLLQENWLYTDDNILNESQKMFVRGFMETRGSFDLNSYFSQDYYYNNRTELKRMQIFAEFMNIPINYLNFNPRELQKDYLRGNKRNTQIRFNVFYYAKVIGFLNHYKALIFEKNYSAFEKKHIKNNVIYFDVGVKRPNNDTSFVNYLNFFTDNIYKQELTKEKVQHIRKNLGFDKNKNGNEKEIRSQTIVEIFDLITPDKCNLCGTTKTFTRKATGRQAFEIHHMIPFHQGKQYDNMANLVKLCSTCHDSLKRGRATKDEQVKNIITILHNNHSVYEYTSAALGVNDIHDLSAQIYNMLG